LQERLASARSQRSPQLVTILGVPGIGKSRLVAELQRAADAAGEPMTWRQGRSLPYGDGISFWALGEIMKAEAEILESDPAEDVERKLGSAVERIVHDPAEAERIATSLQALIGLGGREVAGGAPRGETFAAWRHFLEALADERPLVLVFEDLHWADEGLLDFVDELAGRVNDVPLLVLATARLELLTRRPGWGGGKAGALTMSLPPLSDDETARLVAALLEQPLSGADAKEELLARVAGNPFYAEQFCRMLLDGGDITELPETVHAIIDARIDRLAPEQKRLLRDAAVIGKVFWAGALEAIGRVSGQRADEWLYGLERSEFIHRARRPSIAGDREYAFRHDLLRDVAYGGITRAARAETHRLTAEWIESLGHAEDHAELLAHHYVASLEYAHAAGEDVTGLLEPAMAALQRAGLRAIRLSANDHAAEYLSRAIELVKQLPEADVRSRIEAELQLQLGIALLALRGHSAPEVERAYARATELMMAIAPAAEQLPIHFGLWVFHCQRGNFTRSTPLVDRMTELASDGDDSMRLQALHARWGNSLFGGRIDDAIAAGDAGQAIYRPEAHHQLSFRYGNHDPGVCAFSHQAVALALRGQSATAVERMNRAIELSEAVGHAVSRAEPLSYLPWIFEINGDVDAAFSAAERALALESEVVHPVFFGIAHAMRGWALSQMGQHAEAIEELQRALADQRRVVNHINAVIIGAILAEAHLRNERPDAARSLLDEVDTLAKSMQRCTFEPELLRVEAEWLCAAGHEPDARRLLLQAISTAGQHGSWGLAVRAAVQLARIPSPDRGSDLRRLADLCERLPAENDTDYRREARVLLDGVVAHR
jgi:tetratricopeptide (TPR) repeat protein